MVAAQAPKTGAFQVLVGKIDDILQYAIGDPMRYIANWGRLYSLWPVHLETACCVPPDTLILGDNKTIAEYAPGDEVVGRSGHAGVVRTFDREYAGELVQVTGSGMLPMLLTPEHPLLTASRILRSGKAAYLPGTAWKKAGDLVGAQPVKSNGRLALPSGTHDCLLIPRTKGFVDLTTLSLAPYSTKGGPAILEGPSESPPLEFPLTEETAWFLGVFVADGWSTEGHDVFFSLRKGERKLARRIAATARRLGYAPQTREREDALVVRFSSGILARSLRAWCGRLAENKKIPDFVLYLKKTGILVSFLSGYLKGDGSVTEDPPGPVFDLARTTSKLLALQLQLAYARIGRFARVMKDHREVTASIQGRAVRTRDAYSLSLLPPKRKRAAFRINSDFIIVPILRVSRVPYSGHVKNLETTDNTYLVSNAVVHNCSVEVGAAAGARFDMERFGTLEAFGSLRACDLIIVMGTVTRKLAPRLKMVYDQMAEPKWVIAIGACSRGDSLVYTPGGPVRIDQMRAGDLIYSYDERFKEVVQARVVARKDQGVRDTYRVRAGSYELVATEDHPFAVYERTLSRKWVAYQSLLGMLAEGFTVGEVSPLLGVGAKTLDHWRGHPPPQIGLDLVWKDLRQIEIGDLVTIFAGEVPTEARSTSYTYQGRPGKKIRIPEFAHDKLAWLAG